VAGASGGSPYKSHPPSDARQQEAVRLVGPSWGLSVLQGEGTNVARQIQWLVHGRDGCPGEGVPGGWVQVAVPLDGGHAGVLGMFAAADC